MVVPDICRVSALVGLAKPAFRFDCFIAQHVGIVNASAGGFLDKLTGGHKFSGAVHRFDANKLCAVKVENGEGVIGIISPQDVPVGRIGKAGNL